MRLGGDAAHQHARLLVAVSADKHPVQPPEGCAHDVGGVAARAGERDGEAAGVLPVALAEGVGGEEHGNGRAARRLPAELARAGGRKVGHRLPNVLEVGEHAPEAAGGHDGLLGGRRGLELEAGLSPQLLDRSQPHHAHLPPDPAVGAQREVVGGANAVGGQLLGVASANAPHVAHLRDLKGAPDVPLVVQHEHAVGEPLLGDAVGHLGQRFGGGNAHRNGDARMLDDGLAERLGVGGKADGLKPREVEEGLVDGVHLEVGRKAPQRFHHAVAHVAVEGVVGREYGDAVLGYQLSNLKGRYTHLHPSRLRLVRSGDDAAVVVAEHHHGLSPEGGVEHALARGVEVVAVNQRNHASPPYPSDGCRNHAPDGGLAALPDLYAREGGVGRNEEERGGRLFDGFDGKLPIEVAQRHVAVARGDGAIYHDQVVVREDGLHGVAVYSGKEGGRSVLHEVGVEVYGLLHVVAGGRGKARLHPSNEGDRAGAIYNSNGCVRIGFHDMLINLAIIRINANKVSIVPNFNVERGGAL